MGYKCYKGKNIKQTHNNKRKEPTQPEDKWY